MIETDPFWKALRRYFATEGITVRSSAVMPDGGMAAVDGDDLVFSVWMPNAGRWNPALDGAVVKAIIVSQAMLEKLREEVPQVRNIADG